MIRALVRVLVSRGCSLSAMGSVWSALLVGGGLAGALFVWLLRGGPGDNGKDGDAALGEAAAAGEDQDAGGGGLSPGSHKQELVTKPGIIFPLRVSRAYLPGAVKFTREGKKETHLELY